MRVEIYLRVGKGKGAMMVGRPEGQFFEDPSIENPKVVTFHELCKRKANINAFSLGGKRL
jgi:hypothetical protein